MILIDVDIYQISSGDIIKFDDNQVKFMVDNRGNFVKAFLLILRQESKMNKNLYYLFRSRVKRKRLMKYNETQIEKK